MKIEGLALDLGKIRDALRFIGAAVVDRPMPEIVEGDRNCYCPSTHQVLLAPNATQTTLIHELAHSQQAGVGGPVAYNSISDRSSLEFISAWAVDPLEIAAMAVEEIYPAMANKRAWSIIAPAIEALDISDIQIKAAWIRWLMAGDIKAEKPCHLARRKRQSMNHAMAKLLA